MSEACAFASRISWTLLAGGASRAEILEDYPDLEDGDITAALEFASIQSDHPVLRVA